MAIHLVSIFISSIISKKSKWLSNEGKNIISESISMDRAGGRLYKPCHQAALNTK